MSGSSNSGMATSPSANPLFGIESMQKQQLSFQQQQLQKNGLGQLKSPNGGGDKGPQSLQTPMTNVQNHQKLQPSLLQTHGNFQNLQVFLSVYIKCFQNFTLKIY